MSSFTSVAALNVVVFKTFLVLFGERLFVPERVAKLTQLCSLRSERKAICNSLGRHLRHNFPCLGLQGQK